MTPKKIVHTTTQRLPQSQHSLPKKHLADQLSLIVDTSDFLFLSVLICPVVSLTVRAPL